MSIGGRTSVRTTGEELHRLFDDGDIRRLPPVTKIVSLALQTVFDSLTPVRLPGNQVQGLVIIQRRIIPSSPDKTSTVLRLIATAGQSPEVDTSSPQVAIVEPGKGTKEGLISIVVIHQGPLPAA